MTRGCILGLVAGETIPMAAAGIAFGLGCTYAVYAVLKKTSPTLTTLISNHLVVRGISYAGLFPALYVQLTELPDSTRWTR